MRSMGLDIGDKRIGIALGDPSGILASPFTTINRNDDVMTLEVITEIAKEQEVDIIIAGLPRSMNGSIGRQAEKVEKFVTGLRRQTKIPVEYRDERLSTVSAGRMMKETKTKKIKDKGKIDAIAAAIILQGYMDEDQ